ncbi:antitoxin [Leucobacter coleopterorum]|uniref:Antitoxin n=1 Tax=Leucobacter coleopterorum TaxID=2714933 RepID=A0ABX6K1G5_9MICO|nr:antitoxin [Leucobacter coleopterorum]QIM18945.1 antitoxin [Leucobacter coleopterorum]
MRTTLRIEEPLLEAAKRNAARRQETLGEYVEEALRAYMAAQAVPTEMVDLPVFRGGSGVKKGIDSTSNRDLFDALDEADEQIDTGSQELKAS